MRVTGGARGMGWLAVSLSSIAASIVTSAATSTPVRAQEAPPPPPMPADGAATVAEDAPAHPRRIVSLTISPLHLTLPVLELTGEYRALDKLGVAVIAGVGRYTDNNLSAAAYEAGAQVRYYVVGDFRHGMQVGAE